MSNGRKRSKGPTEAETRELERQRRLGEEVGSTDPGPNAEISRESPSGQPGDTEKPRTRQVPGAP